MIEDISFDISNYFTIDRSAMCFIQYVRWYLALSLLFVYPYTASGRRYYRFFFLWSLLYRPLSPSILSDLKKSVYIETGEEKERSQTQWLSPKDRKLTWIYPEHDLGKRTSFLPFFFMCVKEILFDSIDWERVLDRDTKKKPISVVGSRPFSIAFPWGWHFAQIFEFPKYLVFNSYLRHGD